MTSQKTVSKPVVASKSLSKMEQMSSDNTFNTSEARRCLDDLKRRVEQLQMLLESKMSTNEKNWMSDVHKQLKKILETEFKLPIIAISARVIHV